MIAGAVSKLSPSGTRRRTPSRIPVLWSSYQPAGTAKAGLKNGHSWPLQTVITFSTSAGAARAGLALEGDVVRIGDGLGADEALLEVGVDRAGRLRRARALGHGPGARLLWPGSEIGDQAEKVVAGADDAVETGLGEPDR